jgi:hypothetical protein
MAEFIAGALAMGYWMVGLFFLRFWTKTRDRLFAIFALAFWILGLIRIGLLLTYDLHEHRPTLYWFRLLAYVLILVAVIDKNRRR